MLQPICSLDLKISLLTSGIYLIILNHPPKDETPNQSTRTSLRDQDIEAISETDWKGEI